ncbi:SusD/RagB family nutrient-binding outer membrane lipoprotein [Pedobacter sp. Leaf132]|uniref:SusD/RagB family nutrient-binding outer membrane lipoprotein n=1 Tax=Pedobacter sp. Leaf132 TaxID=2876557 RepID=UPI001E330E7D|nr:SusD/RagB family nutrient-binding outer membrane lipoprotein [Pedobacter sp. Leaf132]
MKKILSNIAITLCSALVITSCKKSEFNDAYRDPSKVTTSSVAKQFAGLIYTNREYVVPSYWNYFVVQRTSVNQYTQAVGWANAIGQYVPPSGGVNDRWSNYYNFLAQYRELQKIYNASSATEQADNRIFMITAAIYFYDHTQKVVDLHGDIPWMDAGKLSSNGGDYSASYAKYQGAESIYTTMLDDLKKFSDDLSTITVPAASLTAFKTQDLINKGNIVMWQKYCNSLRLRILSRVSAVGSLSARSNTEIAGILANSAKYPLSLVNDDNILLKVTDVGSDINAKGFQTGLEDWNGNIAGKRMIDHMKTNADPRLRALFEPGANAAGVYNGLDQSLDATTQTTLINGGTISIYNRSTVSRNQFFPGVLITAAEVNFLLSEYYLKANNDAMAKSTYEAGIKQSVNFYYWVRTVSNDNTAGALTATNDTEIGQYIAKPAIAWAGTNAAKLALLANQKWLHYNVIEPIEGWAELRRLDLPALTYQVDNSSQQKQPPFRWVYPAQEISFNAANYAAVASKDNLTTKLFWDVN